MSDFEAIMKIRARKLNLLTSAETRARNAARAAEQEVRDASQAMLDYAQEIRGLEQDMIADLIDREAHRGDLERLEQVLKRAEARAKALSDAHSDAERRLAERIEALEDARADRIEASRKRDRISVLRDEEIKDERKAALAAEDAAVDEAAEIIAAMRGAG